MLDYHDAYSNDELVVTFENCRFRVSAAVLKMNEECIKRSKFLS